MTPPPRLALGFALALTPDGRYKTRRTIMRGAVVVNRVGKLSQVEQKRLLRGMKGSQRTFAVIGIALYALARRRLPALLVFGALSIYLAYKLIELLVASLG